MIARKMFACCLLAVNRIFRQFSENRFLSSFCGLASAAFLNSGQTERNSSL